MAKSSVTFDPEEIIQGQIVALDDALEKIEKRLLKYNRLIEQKNKLLAARRALLGGNRLTGEGGSRLRLEDIQDYLKDNPGAHATQIAQRFSVATSTVSSHIYRNKQLFRKDKDGGYHNVKDREK